MTQDELNVVLEQHSLWLNTSGKEGTRADLSYVNLSGANLSKADLSNANLSEADLCYANLNNIIGKEIITFQANKHFAYYVDGYIKIGCEFHSLKFWKSNYRKIGKSAGYNKDEIKLYGSWISTIYKHFLNKAN
jgi:hypothetical protein